MSGADGALLFVENNLGLAGFVKIHGGLLKGLTMADAREDAGARRNGVGDEMKFFRRQTVGIQSGDLALMDVEDVFFDVFFDDIPRSDVIFSFHTAHAETFMLTDGVIIDALVRADDLIIKSAYLALFHGDIPGEEGAEISFSDKADTCGVLLFRRGETVLFGKASDFGLRDVGKREKDVIDLRGRDLVQKVGLILIFIGGAHKVGFAVFVLDTAIMSGRDEVGAQLHGAIAEDAEFYFAVTKDVRVGRATFFIFVNEMQKNVVPIFVRKIDRIIRDIEAVANAANVRIILFGSATTVVVRFFPIVHEHPDDVIALLFQKGGGDATVHTSAHTHYDCLFHTIIIQQTAGINQHYRTIIIENNTRRHKMSFNPFYEKPDAIEKTYLTPSEMYAKSYDKNEVDPYTKVRCILMNGTEYEAVGFSHRFFRACPDNDIRRSLAAVRRSEQQQQKQIAVLKPINETVLETTISYEQLAVDLTVALAKREKDPYVKHALDFALLEDFDHLYRFSNLLEMEHKEHAEKLIGSYTEITPGRPTISEHRHPYDGVCRPGNNKEADIATVLNVNIITAAEQQTMNYYMNQAGFYTSDAGRELYQEIGMIEEQHVSRYGSLLDVRPTWLENLLVHEYTECYLYYSCYKDESDPYVKKIWERNLILEISHLHAAAELLEKYEHKNWQEVIPGGEFPELLAFSSQKDYIRNVLQNTVWETANYEDYSLVSALPDGARFFTYQGQVCGDGSEVPSHVVLDRYLSQNKTDYRFEVRSNPVPELADRTRDNTTVGREKVKVRG